MPNFTNKTEVTVPIGDNTDITLEQGRVDQTMFNDFTLQNRPSEDKLVMNRPGGKRTEVIIENIPGLTNNQKQTIREAMSKLHNTNPMVYYYGFSDDFDMDFSLTDLKLSFSYSADAYAIGQIDRWTGTAEYSKINLSSSKDFELDINMRKVVAALVVAALLAIIVWLAGSAAAAAIPALGSALALL